MPKVTSSFREIAARDALKPRGNSRNCNAAEQFAPAVLREREILNKEFAKSKLRPRRKTEIRKIVEAYKSSAPTPYKSSVADLVRPFNVSEAKGKK